MVEIAKKSVFLKYRKKLGRRIRQLLKEKGYKTPYDFWIRKCEGSVSRPALHKILDGKTDPQLSTLLELARLLRIDVKDLLP